MMMKHYYRKPTALAAQTIAATLSKRDEANQADAGASRAGPEPSIRRSDPAARRPAEPLKADTVHYDAAREPFAEALGKSASLSYRTASLLRPYVMGWLVGISLSVVVNVVLAILLDRLTNR